MKNILLILFYFCFSISVFAQTDVAKFVGVPINQNKDAFVNALVEKGYSYTGHGKNYGDYGFENLKGKFWRFEDCTIVVRYSLTTEIVGTVFLHFQNYRENRHLVNKLMNDLDSKYGPRIKVIHNDDEYAHEYRWLSENNMITVDWNDSPKLYGNRFSIAYYSEIETNKIIKEEADKKQSAIEDL